MFQERYQGKIQINELTSVKYLGNKINTDGNNIEDITLKCNKGIGTITKIQIVLETMFFGNFILK